MHTNPVDIEKKRIKYARFNQAGEHLANIVWGLAKMKKKRKEKKRKEKKRKKESGWFHMLLGLPNKGTGKASNPDKIDNYLDRTHKTN